ncbi:hypothetical protein PYCCODRAFT_1378770 [Trametes coccinea BRFM310]|uniref:Uncharacterized protein n=1 Tax=Trametes coccinea (strain BRFM310) TaxID=1353009 RepID=A0A1Y2I688_TRAC3|nr:hypothetical protein PYCCODRAFT_1378770 [Trametes coccinea BRFM310]
MHSQNACAECAQPCSTPYVPQHADYYDFGDICSVLESPSTPVYLLLTGKPPPSRDASASKLSWGTLGFAKWIRSQGASTGVDEHGRNGRPAVLLAPPDMLQDDSATADVEVCLMATFDRTETFRCLPQVLRHFCIPIYPHVDILPNGTHSHAVPSWPIANTWLIALPVHCKMDQVVGRWRDERAGSPAGASFRFRDNDVSRLVALCRRRRWSWETLCEQDPTLREKSLKEYKVRHSAAGDIRA